jgi:CRP/FNR family nitrogen fixation transcriptional regulator
MKTNFSSASCHSSGDYRRLMSRQPHQMKSLDAVSSIMSCRRGQEICHQGQPAEHWYRVIAGVARRCAVRPDGRRQIVGLLLPGDFFGFTVGEEYDFSVEAVMEGTVLASYPRRRAEMLADSDARVARELREVAFEALSRLLAQLLILGRVTASEKVGSFILEMAARTSDGHADRVVLPVSRYDIADYLAVSVETVSRSLTDLKQRGVISLSGTRIVKIVDREALEDGDSDDYRPRMTAHRSHRAHSATAAAHA